MDADVLAAAAAATASPALARALGGSGSRCGKIRLVRVEEARRQVVAGTNYHLTLRLGTGGGGGGEDCGEEVERICSGVVVHQPLACYRQGEDCRREVVRQEEVACVRPDQWTRGGQTGRTVGRTDREDCREEGQGGL